MLLPAHHMKSLQCPQKTGCLKNLLQRTWPLILRTLRRLKAPARSIRRRLCEATRDSELTCGASRGTEGEEEEAASSSVSEASEASERRVRSGSVSTSSKVDMTDARNDSSVSTITRWTH